MSHRFSEHTMEMKYLQYEHVSLQKVHNHASFQYVKC